LAAAWKKLGNVSCWFQQYWRKTLNWLPVLDPEKPIRWRN
jgi:hypothetical protein